MRTSTIFDMTDKQKIDFWKAETSRLEDWNLTLRLMLVALAFMFALALIT